MSVHQKIMSARLQLQALNLKKTGLNKFSGYAYFELGDFMPHINRIFDELRLCGLVSFGREEAILTITDTESNTAVVITSPMSTASLKGCHEVQNLGAVQTYIRRYLWVCALEIVESDAIETDPNTTKAARISATEEIWKTLQPHTQDFLRKVAKQVVEAMPDTSKALELIDMADIGNEEKSGLWYLLDSKTRSAIKKAQKAEA